MPTDDSPTRYLRLIPSPDLATRPNVADATEVAVDATSGSIQYHWTGATRTAVDLHSAQTLAGVKTFTAVPVFAGGTVLALSTAIVTSAATAKTTNVSYQIPANTLNANGRGVRITTWGSCAANGNNKTITVDIGAGAAIAATTGAVANNNGAFRVQVEVIRTGSAALTCFSSALSAATSLATAITDTSDTTGAILVAITSTNGTASTDVIHKGYMIEAF